MGFVGDSNLMDADGINAGGVKDLVIGVAGGGGGGGTSRGGTSVGSVEVPSILTSIASK